MDIEAEDATCQGCGHHLSVEGAGLIMERHLSFVDKRGHFQHPHGAVIVVQLCIPCAWKNINRIERAIADIIKEHHA